jgi:hypothetical protein
VQKDITMTETAGKTEMGAAASNVYSNSAQLYLVKHVGNCGTGNGGGTKGGRSVNETAIHRNNRIQNQAHSIRNMKRNQFGRPCASLVALHLTNYSI